MFLDRDKDEEIGTEKYMTLLGVEPKCPSDQRANFESVYLANSTLSAGFSCCRKVLLASFLMEDHLHRWTAPDGDNDHLKPQPNSGILGSRAKRPAPRPPVH